MLIKPTKIHQVLAFLFSLLYNQIMAYVRSMPVTTEYDSMADVWVISSPSQTALLLLLPTPTANSLQNLGQDTDMLKKAGFTDAEISKISSGLVPSGWQV